MRRWNQQLSFSKAFTNLRWLETIIFNLLKERRGKIENNQLKPSRGRKSISRDWKVSSRDWKVSPRFPSERAESLGCGVRSWESALVHYIGKWLFGSNFRICLGKRICQGADRILQSHRLERLPIHKWSSFWMAHVGSRMAIFWLRFRQKRALSTQRLW